MILGLDGKYWKPFFLRRFVPQINIFCDTLIRRVYPEFESIGLEADEVAEAEYERIGNIPCSEYDAWDMSDAAEQAFEVGLAYYDALDGVRQSLLNLSIVALYHMLEQQLLLFHRKQVLHPRDENSIAMIKISEMKKMLLARGVNLEIMHSWPKINELQIVANAIKHAEGRSSEQVKNLRPDLCQHPVLKERQYDLSYQSSIYMPMAGKDIYIDISDLESYRSAIVDFWNEFGDAIQQY